MKYKILLVFTGLAVLVGLWLWLAGQKREEYPVGAYFLFTGDATWAVYNNHQHRIISRLGPSTLEHSITTGIFIKQGGVSFLTNNLPSLVVTSVKDGWVAIGDDDSVTNVLDVLKRPSDVRVHKGLWLRQ